MTSLDSNHSYWHESAPRPGPRSGKLPSEADVVVVGGGIAGVTTAYLLTGAGRRVALLEADRIASGTTGRTTAKISAQHSLKYDRLTTMLGSDTAEQYAASQSAALEWIGAESARLGVDCDFERRDSYVFTNDVAQRDILRQEADAAVRAGLPATLAGGEIGLPFGVETAVHFTDQAQFHPLRWLHALAEAAERQGCVIAEGSTVHDVHEGSDGITVTSGSGVIKARDVVIATQYPMLDRGLYFARLDPIHELVIGVPVDKPLPGMYLAVDSGHSIRTAPMSDGGHLMIVLGEHFRTGEGGDVGARYRRLERWARAELGVGEPLYHWSAHDLSTPDGVPYIGRYHPRTEHLWVATGFGQWGMTGGTLAGLLLRDLITGVSNEWESLYNPNRLPPVRAVASMVWSNLTVARHLAADHAWALLGLRHPDQLTAGESTVTRVAGRLVAAYRDDDEQLHVVAARCTHLGCLVAFNNADKTWDCPCHSSRFGLDGTVLNGPAVEPLDRDSLDDPDR